ncbi:hypothetical protein E4U43_002080 [Claviceps pusilla]|uniref:Uncharacterized protein n=1 Tax=Claviceps pusilla TaxID=123648 RepID=A0A9P7N7K5_9HYPO|nr:hypothetical protein E4U43_002080 [Claviceps pusilla]
MPHQSAKQGTQVQGRTMLCRGQNIPSLRSDEKMELEDHNHRGQVDDISSWVRGDESTLAPFGLVRQDQTIQELLKDLGIATKTSEHETMKIIKDEQDKKSVAILDLINDRLSCTSLPRTFKGSPTDDADGPRTNPRCASLEAWNAISQNYLLGEARRFIPQKAGKTKRCVAFWFYIERTRLCHT